MSGEPAYAVIRVRGSIKVHRSIRDTLRYLNLTRVNHCVVVPGTKEYLGMILRAKDYVTWGEVDPETLARLIFRRGRLTGERRITDRTVKERTPYRSIMSLAKAVTTSEYVYGKIPDIKPVFRLHPPKGGYRTIKRAFSEGGSLGYRGKEINALIHSSLSAEEKAQKVDKDDNKK